MITFTLNFDDTALIKEAGKKNDEIGKAVVAAAFIMRDNARQNLKSSPYKMDNVAEGIMLGTIKKDYRHEWHPKVKLHSFGYLTKDSTLARIFVGGTVPRYTGKSKRQLAGYEIHRNKRSSRRAIWDTPQERFTGYIRNSEAIERAVNQGILDNKINEVLK